jgi:predicted ATP-grasp superfamily ATP-dependent carboligase
MEPSEYKRLQELSAREGVSIAELVRRAVADRYFLPDGKERKRKALDSFLNSSPMPIEAWSVLKKELADRYGAHIP